MKAPPQAMVQSPGSDKARVGWEVFTFPIGSLRYLLLEKKRFTTPSLQLLTCLDGSFGGMVSKTNKKASSNTCGGAETLKGGISLLSLVLISPASNRIEKESDRNRSKLKDLSIELKIGK